jgi:hypothetical protein
MYFFLDSINVFCFTLSVKHSGDVVISKHDPALLRMGDSHNDYSTCHEHSGAADTISRDTFEPLSASLGSLSVTLS